jgi:hypothetical protein
VLAREHARQGHALRTAQAELERTHKTLKDSFWHLQKIQEVLPVCVSCHKVKTGDGTWNDFVRFFHDHSDFLSHGYCPDCLADAVKELGFSDDDERG